MKSYKVPRVIVDSKEKELMDTLTNQYEKMITPRKNKNRN